MQVASAAMERDQEATPPPLGERPFFIALMLLVLPPYGLVLFWRSEMWPYQVKWLVTAGIFAGIVWVVGKLPG